MSLYRQYDIFVLASVIAPNGDRDGIPVVLMEAGACGLPLISTDVSGIPELVRHGQTGLVVPSGDPTALAEAINTIAVDTSLRKRLGQNAQALVEGEYNSEINTIRLKSLFFETILKAKIST
jgi:glycosyltransferase involved in cell wall biosynthesis